MNDDLKIRTKDFAIRIIQLFAALAEIDGSSSRGKQILAVAELRSEHNIANLNTQSPTPTSSVRSKARLQELEETSYWLELLEEMQFFDRRKA